MPQADLLDELRAILQQALIVADELEAVSCEPDPVVIPDPDPVVIPDPPTDLLPSMRKLRVDSRGRRLEREDGSKFAWIADTAWFLTTLDRDDIRAYLDMRAEQGFTVIQGPIVLPISTYEGQELAAEPTQYANAYGEVPFTGPSSAGYSLNEAYLEHVDFMVDECQRRGLYICPAAIWGLNLDNLFYRDEASAIATALGNRYADRDHVVWIAVGEYHKIAWGDIAKDRKEPDDYELDLLDTWASSIKGDHSHLVTIHPTGGRSSSDHFQSSPWCAFNNVQTYQLREAAGQLIRADMTRSPRKPVLNMEPGYEGRTDIGTKEAVFQAYDGVFSGGFGHTYGHHAVWGGTVYSTREDVLGSLQSDGAQAMLGLRNFMERFPGLIGRRFNGVIGAGNGRYDDATRKSALGHSGLCAVYVPQSSGNVSLRLDQMNKSAVKVRRYLPSSNKIVTLGTFADSLRSFPASAFEGTVLILQAV